MGTSPPAPQKEYNVYLLKQPDKVPGIVGFIIEFCCALTGLNEKLSTEIKKEVISIIYTLEKTKNYSNEEKFGYLEKKYLKYGVDVYVDFAKEFIERVTLYKKKYASLDQKYQKDRSK